jgi:hypothetical protein
LGLDFRSKRKIKKATTGREGEENGICWKYNSIGTAMTDELLPDGCHHYTDLAEVPWDIQKSKSLPIFMYHVLTTLQILATAS